MKLRGRIKGMKKGLRKNQSTIMCSCIIVLLLVITSLIGSNLIGQTVVDDDETTTTETTTTTTETTTTTTTTTTIPEEADHYIIRFRFEWGASIDDDDKCWLEFSVYDYHDITPSGRKDMATFAAAAEKVWYPGSWDTEFVEGEALSIGMASHLGWYDFEDPFYVDVVVGPWSNSFTFHSYKYGFSIMLTGTLMVNWELV